MSGRKFGRHSQHRLGMLTNLAKSLLTHGRITTTLPKAKDLRPFVERLITKGKKSHLNSADLLHTRRVLISKIGDNDIVTKLMTEIPTKYATRAGGYTRIIKCGNRAGDCAPIAIIELVEGLPEIKAAS